MTAGTLVWAAMGVVALTGAVALLRLAAARHVADIVLILQLISAKTIAVFFLFAVLRGEPAFAETALAIALLGAVVAAVFAFRRPAP